MNRVRLLTALATAALLVGIAGCAKQSPAQTQADVSKAEDVGAESVAAAERDATSTMVNAGKDVAVAKAEAAHKVAIARCEGSSGDVRKACLAQADADLATAKANADATKIANDPKS